MRIIAVFSLLSMANTCDHVNYANHEKPEAAYTNTYNVRTGEYLYDNH
jgi:hypothetical protein